MPSATAVYDPEEVWKLRQYNDAKWNNLLEGLQKDLRPFYPDKAAVACSQFGHPADEWVAHLLDEAWDAISITHGIGLRLTKEQLLVEQQDMLTTLEKAVRVLSNVSPDLDRLFGLDADILGTRDKIQELIPFIAGSEAQIAGLPRALQRKEVQHAAAVEVAIRVLRLFKDRGGQISATANVDHQYFSDAVKLLKILGDKLGLALDFTTWKKVVKTALSHAPDLKKVRKAP